MGYAVHGNTTICSQIKTSYVKIVVPFEDYVKRVKLAGGTPPPDPTILNDDVPILPDFVNKVDFATPKNNGADSLATPRSDAGGASEREEVSAATVEKVRTASDKLNEALKANGDGKCASLPRWKFWVDADRKFNAQVPPRSSLACFLRRGSRPISTILPARCVRSPGPSLMCSDFRAGLQVCEICTMDNDPDKIVLCDGCDRGYHLNCLSPPLSEVPASQFFCDTCLLMNGAEYGFEEGEDHSLHSFRRRADAFKRKWLGEHPMPANKGKGRETDPEEAMQDGADVVAEQMAIEDHFEREFWRLVESQHESVEVEYGADLNSTRDGGCVLCFVSARWLTVLCRRSGLPNLEIHPNDPYSRDGWNLNNLPILAGSLLRYIKSDISGMTIPWIYVGMVFSTFAWHKEDHYTYRCAPSRPLPRFSLVLTPLRSTASTTTTGATRRPGMASPAPTTRSSRPP